MTEARRQKVARVMHLLFLVAGIIVELANLDWQAKGSETVEGREHFLRRRRTATKMPLFADAANGRALVLEELDGVEEILAR